MQLTDRNPLGFFFGALGNEQNHNDVLRKNSCTDQMHPDGIEARGADTWFTTFFVKGGSIIYECKAISDFYRDLVEVVVKADPGNIHHFYFQMLFDIGPGSLVLQHMIYFLINGFCSHLDILYIAFNQGQTFVSKMLTYCQIKF